MKLMLVGLRLACVIAAMAANPLSKSSAEQIARAVGVGTVTLAQLELHTPDTFPSLDALYLTGARNDV